MKEFFCFLLIGFAVLLTGVWSVFDPSVSHIILGVYLFLFGLIIMFAGLQILRFKTKMEQIKDNIFFWRRFKKRR